jgi:hypothetical protein
MLIYTIVGMSSFGNIKLTGALNEIVNFRTFASSFMLLLRLATSAGWNDILDPLMIVPPDCNIDQAYLPDSSGGWSWQDSSNGDCPQPWLAVIFMTSYVLIIFLIIINMYIAVILENFNQAHEQEEVGITEDDFDMFYVIWERYDPLASQFIKYEQLPNFVHDLEEPLGIPKPNEIAIVSFDLPIIEGDKLHCLDILMALVKRVLGHIEESDEFQELHNQMEEKFKETFPTRVNTVVKTTTLQRKKDDVAAKTLQRAWKSFKTQRALKQIISMGLQQQASNLDPSMSHSRENSVLSLGRRLSNALSAFFSSSRPSSAISRLSVRSTTSGRSINSPKQKKKKLTTSTLQVPDVGALYSSDSESHVDL